jgi:hypothetical protein
MTKRLMIGLLTGVLMATLLPGVAVAKDKGDTSHCKKGEWADWVRADGTAFADQSECVAYVAEGGTLMPPVPVSTFQSVCVELGGTNLAEKVTWATYSPACEWWEPISMTDFSTVAPTLGPFCPFTDADGLKGTGTYYWGADGIEDPYAWWGCVTL